MKKITGGLILVVIGIAVLFALNKSHQKPCIVLARISADSVISMQDTLVVDLKFEENSCQVGDSIKGPSKVYLEDTGYKVTQEFSILRSQVRSGNGRDTGKLRVLVDLLPMLDTVSQRVTALKIYITDRKGNKSNTVMTPAIYLFKAD